MRLIIAGTRDFNDFDFLNTETLKFIKTVRNPEEDIIIISGCARGADKLGERFAHRYGLKLHKLPADWKLYGKLAGYRRNRDMAEIATHCICFWDGKSKGTKSMIDIATQKDLILKVVIYGEAQTILGT